jgi:ABC-type transport system substrate-binding protein
VEGISVPQKRSDRVVLEANMDYWDTTRRPRLQRIIFDNTITQKDAFELVKTVEGRVDLVTGLRPLETLRVASSAFATVVKNRGNLGVVFGRFNMRKAASPWTDLRLRHAVNYAINREDLIRYAAKGNGEIIPALISPRGLGYDPALTPYAFDPEKARRLLREAGYPDGRSISVIASEDLEVQATVISNMLRQVGFTVELDLLDPAAYARKTILHHLEQPPEQQAWDLALTSWGDIWNFPVFSYHLYALDGPEDWVMEDAALRGLYDQVLRLVDREQQQAVLRQMERHTHAQAYFLFLYSPIQLYAVNKAVAFVPYVTTVLNLAETAVTEQHWSVRKQGTAVQE